MRHRVRDARCGADPLFTGVKPVVIAPCAVGATLLPDESPSRIRTYVPRLWTPRGGVGGLSPERGSRRALMESAPL